uniref:ATP synthase subunit a n=1 Tax=Phagocata gracilis TaxID=1354672 RepID=A0A0C4ZKF9_9PLAT
MFSVLDSVGFPWFFATIPIFLNNLQYFPINNSNSLKIFFFYFFWNINNLKFNFVIFSSVFETILAHNIFGILPYSFSSTSHFIFVSFISFIMWAISFSSKNFLNYIAHHTPQSAPLLIAASLSIIEFISNIIRPLTLTLRLSINITTGHVFFYLLSNWIISICSLFEIFVSFIQSTIFILLIIQYTSNIV